MLSTECAFTRRGLVGPGVSIACTGALGLIDSLGSIDGLLQPDQRKTRARLCAALRACGMQAQVDDLDLSDEEEFYAEK